MRRTTPKLEYFGKASSETLFDEKRPLEPLSGLSPDSLVKFG